MPGIAATIPPWYITRVNSAPTTIGGEKLNTNFLAGPERSGICARRAFSTIAASITLGRKNAEPSQTSSAQRSRHLRRNDSDDCAQHADRHHSPPRYGGERPCRFHCVANESEVVHCPDVKRGRLGGGGGRSGRTDVIRISYGAAYRTVKYFAA